MSTTTIFDVSTMNGLNGIVKSVYDERYLGDVNYSQIEANIEDRSFAILLPKPILKNYLTFPDGVNHEVNCINIKIIEKEDGYFTKVVYRTRDTTYWIECTNPDYFVRVSSDDDFYAFKWVVCDSMKAD